jgi:hypothetical protein
MTPYQLDRATDAEAQAIADWTAPLLFTCEGCGMSFARAPHFGMESWNLGQSYCCAPCGDGRSRLNSCARCATARCTYTGTAGFDAPTWAALTSPASPMHCRYPIDPSVDYCGGHMIIMDVQYRHH